jgi:protein-L-isoaspartate(D-aspartate) O-methyltransferase
MTDLLDIQSGDRILEIGTGLGYQAAVLAELAQQIYTVEIIQELAQEAASRLLRQGYYNVAIGVADGSRGWPDHAPYDKIIVTAAPELIPVAFFNQLKTGGKMVVPAGFETAQQLMLVEKDDDGSISTEEILPVRFSPLTVTH